MKQLMRGKYFALTEVCFLSLMGALVYVLRAFIKTPTHGILPGHNAIIWVIPFIIGLGLTRKFGSATYIGVVSGLLLGILGDHEGGLKFFEYLGMGFTMDVMGLFFKGHVGNVIVCVLLGAFGSFAKFVVNYGLAILLSEAANVLLAGVAWPATSPSGLWRSRRHNCICSLKPSKTCTFSASASKSIRESQNSMK